MKYAFLGVGNMAGAIIGGMTSSSAACSDILLYDCDSGKYAAYTGKGFTCCGSAPQAVEAADYIFLSVKPQNFPELLDEIKKSGIDLAGKTFVSIAAGISTGYIRSALGYPAAVIRTMPNTPLLIGHGVTAICRGDGVTDEAFECIKNVFASSSSVYILDESEMNRVIAATSSSPAYVYLFIKSIYEAAQKQGLDYEGMRESICDMVIGSAELVRQSPKSFDELIAMVTSKGGTTQKAMDVFAAHDFTSMMSEAMQACTDRADELGK